jgi:zinc protease
VERRRLETLGVTEVVLSNGVRVFLKPTDFQDDTILFEGLAPGGVSMAGDDELESAEAAGALAAESGWAGHSPVVLEKLLAGEVASSSPYFQERHHGVSGSSSVADLETALTLAVLQMTAPNRDPGAFDRLLARWRARLVNRDADPAAKYADLLTRVNTRDHPRARPMTLERLAAIDLDECLAFYRRCFAKPSEFAFFVVGNADPDAVIPVLERTLGALRDRRAAPNAWVDRQVLFAERSARETVRAGREPKATTTIVFASYDGSDPHEWHRVRTVCSVLERRLRERLREDRGATYGVGVGYAHSLIGPARGRVSVRFGSAPAEAASLGDEVIRAVRELAAAGPTEEEIAKEKELQRRELETSLEQNGFWLGNLTGLWLRGRPLEEVLDRRARIEALDRAALARSAAGAFDLERFTWLAWLPEEGAAP